MYIDPGVRNFVLLCVVVIAIVGGVVWHYMPDPGIREFQASNEALKKVKSWKFKIVDRTTYFTQENASEIVCPASQHGVIQSIKYDGTSNNRYETFVVGGKGYVYNDTMKSWEVRDDFQGPEVICTKLGLGLDIQPFPAFLRLIKMAEIRKSDLKTVEGVQCRLWIAKMPVTGQFNESEEVCIAPDTHLPVERKSHYAAGTYLFTNWNEPFDIQPPVAPPQSTPQSARDAFQTNPRRRGGF